SYPLSAIRYPLSANPLYSPRMKRLAALALFVLVAIAAIGPIRSYDYFWQLAAGRWIVDHHALPASDPLAIASEKSEWIDGEWLWQAAASVAHNAGGDNAMSIYHALFVGAIFGARCAPLPRVALYAALTIVWINVHPSALLAPVLAAIAMLIDVRRWIVAAVSAAALLVNPYGWKAIAAPLNLSALIRSGQFV